MCYRSRDEKEVWDDYFLLFVVWRAFTRFQPITVHPEKIMTYMNALAEIKTFSRRFLEGKSLLRLSFSFAWQIPNINIHFLSYFYCPSELLLPRFKSQKLLLSILFAGPNFPRSNHKLELKKTVRKWQTQITYIFFQ